MDTTDPDIQYDEKGVCSHCRRYDSLLPKRVFNGKEGQTKLSALVKKIKKEGFGKKYDCIIGVSGGVDSTYVAYLTNKLGLRPLAVHLDNGWNTELSTRNIENTLKILDIDLHTHVVDWDEFRELQISFLKSSTPDVEIPTDHAIAALLFIEASKRGIRYIISGMNFATESMAVKAWSYGHSDWKYISSIHRIYGSGRLNAYPYYNFSRLFRWSFIEGIKVVSILNYVPYIKKDVMETLKNELGWVYYGNKHYESVYTRFCLGYILPNKFNIDKRKGHLSNLILSGQITREEALEQLRENAYEPQLLRQDFEYVTDKLKLTDESFRQLMELPNKSYKDYPNKERSIYLLKRFVNYLRSKGIYSK